jgi:hypothetical protein
VSGPIPRVVPRDFRTQIEVCLLARHRHHGIVTKQFISRIVKETAPLAARDRQERKERLNLVCVCLCLCVILKTPHYLNHIRCHPFTKLYCIPLHHNRHHPQTRSRDFSAQSSVYWWGGQTSFPYHPSQMREVFRVTQVGSRRVVKISTDETR